MANAVSELSAHVLDTGEDVLHFSSALGITAIRLLACSELAAITPTDVLHGRWHQYGIDGLLNSGHETMAMQLRIHTMQQGRGCIYANAFSKALDRASFRHIH